MNALMTASDLAEVLRLHRKTVLRLAREGRLPAVQVGGGESRHHLRFDWHQVAEALGISEQHHA